MNNIWVEQEGGVGEELLQVESSKCTSNRAKMMCKLKVNKFYRDVEVDRVAAVRRPHTQRKRCKRIFQ